MTPFTFSLLIYVVIGLLLALRSVPGVRVALAAILFLFPTLVHVYLETPADQYHTWAHASRVNLLGVDSPLLGAGAVAITVLLSAFAFATFVAFWREFQGRVRSDN